MCGKSAPKAPTVDPEAERRKAEAEAMVKANQDILAASRRKRAQSGLLSSEPGSSVLATATPKTTSKRTVLGPPTMS